MNEKIKVMYAGFWLRFFAYIIDLAIIAAVTAALLRPVFAMFSLPVGSASLSLYGVSGLMMFLLYFILMTKFTNGQTLGKMIIGLRVISPDEDKISWKTIIFREGVCRYFLQAFPWGVLYVVAAFTGKKQGIGDLLCDTYVVKDEVYELVNSLDCINIDDSFADSNYAGSGTAMYSSENVIGSTISHATDSDTVISAHPTAGAKIYSSENVDASTYNKLENSVVVECNVSENVIEEKEENDTRDDSLDESDTKGA